MKRKEIIKRVRKCGLPKRHATIAVDAVLNAVKAGLETSDIVRLEHPTDPSKSILAYRGN